MIRREVCWVLVGAKGLKCGYGLLNRCDFLRFEDGLEDSEDCSGIEWKIARAFFN